MERGLEAVGQLDTALAAAARCITTSRVEPLSRDAVERSQRA